MKLDLIITTKKVRSLSRLRGEGRGGGAARVGLPVWREPARIASCDAIRPPPQAGEVTCACG